MIRLEEMEQLLKIFKELPEETQRKLLIEELGSVLNPKKYEPPKKQTLAEKFERYLEGGGPLSALPKLAISHVLSILPENKKQKESGAWELVESFRTEFLKRLEEELPNVK